MKTPIQELIEYFNENRDLDPYVLSLIIRGKLQELINKERQFAETCFDAGINSDSGFIYAIQQQIEPKEVDFTTFYKQYEK